MCPQIQLQNFISDKKELIEESLMFVDDYDMPELIESDIPELINSDLINSDLIDMPELINREYFYDRPELEIRELVEAFIEYIDDRPELDFREIIEAFKEYIDEYVRGDNQ